MSCDNDINDELNFEAVLQNEQHLNELHKTIWNEIKVQTDDTCNQSNRNFAHLIVNENNIERSVNSETSRGALPDKHPHNISLDQSYFNRQNDRITEDKH